jgi:acyl transferase domain-containing protein
MFGIPGCDSPGVPEYLGFGLFVRSGRGCSAQPPNRGGLPRLGGVNSFGFGGTNAHAIVQEGDAAPEGLAEADGGRAELLLLSARSEAALADLARSFCRYLAGASDRLSDIAYTAAAWRSHHPR